ncbi:MAG: plasmid stabilization protein [Deltaproteobacteria bacterium]|nr:MAG: plasmid stabilization protein [Deltaproteobacteria bacterium]
MNLKHEIIWTNVAENDLKNIIEYISIDRPQTALKILSKIKERTSDFYLFPERGRIVPELQEQGISQYRELVITPWRLIYKIVERKIFVLAMIDSRQNVEDILLNRLIYI